VIAPAIGNGCKLATADDHLLRKRGQWRRGHFRAQTLSLMHAAEQ
jgi:hypothetical protein